MTTEKAKIAPWKGALLRWGGSALVLALLLWLLRAHLPEMLATMRRVPPAAWLVVLAGYIGTHLIGVTKWRLMVSLAGAEISWPVAARCYFAGLFANMFLPSIVGGDVVRAGLGMTAGKSRASVLLGSFLDRLLDVLALAGVGAFGALMLPTALDARSRRIFWMFAAVSLAGLAAALAAWKLFAARVPLRVRRKLVRVRQAWRSMAERKAWVALAFTMAVAVQSGFLILMAHLSTLSGMVIALHLWFFAFPLAKLSAMLPLTQGGLGVREVALAALLAPFGAPPPKTVAVGLLWETIVYAGGLLAGLLALIFGRATRQRAFDGLAAPDKQNLGNGAVSSPRFL